MKREDGKLIEAWANGREETRLHDGDAGPYVLHWSTFPARDWYPVVVLTAPALATLRALLAATHEPTQVARYGPCNCPCGCSGTGGAIAGGRCAWCFAEHKAPAQVVPLGEGGEILVPNHHATPAGRKGEGSVLVERSDYIRRDNGYDVCVFCAVRAHMDEQVSHRDECPVLRRSSARAEQSETLVPCSVCATPTPMPEFIRVYCGKACSELSTRGMWHAPEDDKEKS